MGEKDSEKGRSIKYYREPAGLKEWKAWLLEEIGFIGQDRKKIFSSREHNIQGAPA